MGNDQLLPAYNVQFGICDEYIAIVDVNHFKIDMDCFIPLMEKYHKTYGFYPKYPVADAGYGSLNNYIYCKLKRMGLYMKFPMFEKETKDEKYHNDPFRSINFKIKDGKMYCPNNKEMIFKYRKAIQGNNYGREEEIYECSDCSNCPLAASCKKTDKNRTVRKGQLSVDLEIYLVSIGHNLYKFHNKMKRIIQ